MESATDDSDDRQKLNIQETIPGNLEVEPYEPNLLTDIDNATAVAADAPADTSADKKRVSITL